MLAKRVVFAILVLALALGLASCGATPETLIQTVEVPKTVIQTVEVTKPVIQTVEVEKTVPVEVTTVVEKPIEKVVITLAYGRFLRISFGPGPTPFDAIRQAVAAKYPNIEVTLNLVPDSMNAWHDALAVWISAEDPTVDIYGMDTPWVKEFGKAGWAVPLDTTNVPGLSNLEPAGLDVFSYEGKGLGVPFWGSLSGLFYRKDLVEAAGFQPPQTFDDLTAIAQKVMADNPDVSGFLWPGAKDEALVMVWASMLYGFGGQYFDDAGKCAINSTEGVAAVQYLLDALDTGMSPAETTAWTQEEARTRFAGGKGLFLYTNADMVSWLDNPDKSSVAGKWGLMQVPAQTGGRHAGITGGFAFAVNPYTDNMDETLKVMDVIASEEVQKAFAIAWGPVQYYKGLYDDPEVQAANANSAAIGAILPSAMNRPPSSNYAEVSTILQEEIHSALTGIKPVQQALDDACQRIDEVEAK